MSEMKKRKLTNVATASSRARSLPLNVAERGDAAMESIRGFGRAIVVPGTLRGGVFVGLGNHENKIEITVKIEIEEIKDQMKMPSGTV